MRALDRKMIRDLLLMRGQVIATSLVMACGVATFVMSLSTLESLERTLDTYYEHYRFADVFTHLKRAPDAVAARIAEIPGVARVHTRVVEHVTLDVAGLKEPAIGRLISLPDHGRPALNELYLRRGRFPEPGRAREVVVSEAFADTHALDAGDHVRAVINGRLDNLTVVGVAMSPEYIYQVREGEVLPDNRRFAVMWICETELAAAFDMDGAFNDVTLSLMPGASEAEVIRRIDHVTADYGGLGAYGRDDQISHKFVINEIKELRAMTVIIPTIFLGVAAFLLNVVLSRLISTQREEIAALKALGYTRLAIGSHYLKMVMLLVIIGVAFGSAIGAWLGAGLTRMYTIFFNFPVFAYDLDASVLFLAFFVTAGAGAVGTLGAVRRAMLLPPAEAMRPEPPAAYRPTIAERAGLARILSPATRMILRQLERRPVKALLSCFGIALAVSILVLGNYMEDAVDYVIEFEFRAVQRQDLTVTFTGPASREALHAIRNLPGVRHCEPTRGLAARLRHGHLSRRVGIMGLSPEGELFQPLDMDERPVPLPPEGLVLSDRLADLLGVSVGETITVEILEESRPVRAVPVVALVADFSGMSAYMDIDAANRLMRQEDVLNGAFIAADPDRIDELYHELKNTPQVAGVAVKEATLESFYATLAEFMLTMKSINVLFAVIIAFGVVYNGARVSLAERSRELATLRVIGFTRAEASLIQLGELAVLTVIAVPMGLAMGYGFAAATVASVDSELFRMPLVVSDATYAFATTVVVIAALLSGLVVRRMIDRLDLVAVLKTKE